MLGGTGIAEVVLPVEERIQKVKETELAALKLNRRYAYSKGMDNDVEHNRVSNDFTFISDDDLKGTLPKEFGKGPGKKRQPSSDILSEASPTCRPRSLLVDSATCQTTEYDNDDGS